MWLEGSCQCGAVTFRVHSRHPEPYQRCYCGICRKIQGGGGGFSINLSAEFDTLEVKGRRRIAKYHAKMHGRRGRAQESEAERSFCRTCGTGLWLYDSRWPDQVHPYASVIDTPLPVPSEHTHLFIDSKPDWVEVERHKGDLVFGEYPQESIAEWHERTGMAESD
jgi:hypothetical protein